MTVGLLSLPQELLRRVVDLIGTTENEDDVHFSRYCVDYFWIPKNAHVERSVLARKRLETICNLRLVNRRLYDTASHSLVPTLKIQLTAKSLNRAEKLLRIPQVASGVHTVRVSAAYCHYLLTLDLEMFAMCRRSISDCWETEYQQGREIIRGCAQFYGEDFRHVKKAQSNLTLLSMAWDEIELGVSVTDSHCPSHRAMVQKAFDRLQSQRQEQIHLVTTGQFATRLASLLALLPRLRSLYIEDTADDLLEPERMTEVLDVPCSDRISNFLAKGEGWSSCLDYTHIDDSGPEDEVIAAALLHDIPIALLRAGVRLDHLYVCCFPPANSFKFLEPSNCFLQASPTELRHVYSSGMQFHFTLQCSMYSAVGQYADSHRPLIDYLMLCTTGVFLQDFNHYLDSLLTIDFGNIENVLAIQEALNEMALACLDGVDTSLVSASNTETGTIVQAPGPRTVICCHSKLYVCAAKRSDIVEKVMSAAGSPVADDSCLVEIRKKQGEDSVWLLQYLPDIVPRYR